MILNSFRDMADAAMTSLLKQNDRRKEEINVTTERRKQVNLANQAFEDLCKVCGMAGCVTCADESAESYYADRAEWLDAGMP